MDELLGFFIGTKVGYDDGERIEVDKSKLLWLFDEIAVGLNDGSFGNAMVILFENVVYNEGDLVEIYEGDPLGDLGSINDEMILNRFSKMYQ